MKAITFNHLIDSFTLHKEGSEKTSRIVYLMAIQSFAFPDETEFEGVEDHEELEGFSKARFLFKKITEKTIIRLQLHLDHEAYTRLNKSLKSENNAIFQINRESRIRRLDNTVKELEQLKVLLLEVMNELYD